MKIIRWLLSHFFIILLVVIVIYGYMFWGNLAGENTPAGKALAYLSSEFVEVEEFINAVKAKQARLTDEKSTTASVQDSADKSQQMETNLAAGASAQVNPNLESSEQVASGQVASGQASSEQKNPQQTSVMHSGSVQHPTKELPSVTAPVQQAVNAQQDNVAQQSRDITQSPVIISYSHNQVRVKQSSTGEIETQAAITPPVMPRVLPNRVLPNRLLPNSQKESRPNKVPLPVDPAAEKFVSAEVEQRLENVNRHGQVIDKALQGNIIRETWITARKSFYQRNYSLSEQSYMDVIASTKDNFDAYGELGNVYFNQGKKKQAAEAYFEAASILVSKGQHQRAKSLLGIIRSLDRNKANKLQALIQTTI